MKDTMIAFETRPLSSLTKVFADSELADTRKAEGTALWKEIFSFQIAYRADDSVADLRIAVDSPLAPYITMRTVGLAPSEMPVYANPDEHYLRTVPGLFPDPLYPLTEGLRAVAGQWRSVWVTVALPSRPEAGDPLYAESTASYPIDIVITDAEGKQLGAERFQLEVIQAELPDQKLLHTEWFHSDCLATQYGVEVFSEAHWQLIERYVQNAAAHGVNMLLTPLFTPPLDTAVGGERPTVQLIGVEQLDGQEYRFDFTLLKRWVQMCRKQGIKHFEFSHLFTQWGAKHAPKIVAAVNGEEKRIFGWETEATGEEYTRFLDQFLPQLVQFIRGQGLEKNSYFHVSDEPHAEHLEAYRQASHILKRHLSEFSFIEALSDYEFFDHGLVPIPIPSNDHITPFLENGVEPLWTYYCCGQHRDVSNRFFSMPSSRNRVLGLQLYKFGIQGFLHWGYNFWYSRHSIHPIDPFRVTDAVYAFPSGDAFAVYPGAEGPLDSIRWEVFHEALQDQRALELLEQLAGKDEVLELLERGLDEAITFKNYPVDKDWLLGTRESINRRIAELLADKS
ncbi:DUF4091 domain-containing protein [Paenibacillus nasutitermitis]|uniref:Glycoside hydrolase 123 catalytic domain-containing protein n=1 Tax=Paenibacillus nasutitermitis TaxID=1652958 RepID=A0A916YJW1_9BACL|nr:DUF4091 domain-containing protein [Paenibacillus nasutitermitis]GGD48457.1 hypothetical protein GCM10010911_02450 [Paenibacillus nasutitermitis]